MYKWTDGTELFHHGIKGQKWGVQNGPPYPLDNATHNRVVKGNGHPLDDYVYNRNPQSIRKLISDAKTVSFRSKRDYSDAGRKKFQEAFNKIGDFVASIMKYDEDVIASNEKENAIAEELSKEIIKQLNKGDYLTEKDARNILERNVDLCDDIYSNLWNGKSTKKMIDRLDAQRSDTSKKTLNAIRSYLGKHDKVYYRTRNGRKIRYSDIIQTVGRDAENLDRNGLGEQAASNLYDYVYAVASR